MTQARTTRRTVRPEERRQDILEAALTLFAERGYRGASLATIAEKAGLTQQGLLHYFPSKERLLTEVLRLRDERDMAATGTADTTLDALARIVELNQERRGMVQSYTVLSADSVTEGHPARDFFTERYERLRLELAKVVRAELGDSPRAGMTPETAATLLIAVMDGLQLQWLLSDETVDMAGAFRGMLELLRTHPSG
ncbi:TetR/AcrR family transcriptional regulator [Phytomonospora endophytica]|uniref:AcrR family transcriptional regulator n=1 Tax=Phytomonospora endophytica TaxID=714109 RepID=A0A841FVA2_9ACTN|nr:TetR/AcrR family transcriptional regulator [Phytomonospora endophytica]MBB6035910.1 AcrR family transcriptional regulator [Phytomonospora endophytica]GIG71093.1 TetR family transcriptional regulator [Phytomonospora endophytica]